MPGHRGVAAWFDSGTAEYLLAELLIKRTTWIGQKGEGGGFHRERSLAPWDNGRSSMVCSTLATRFGPCSCA
jgi:hypothetical protein